MARPASDIRARLIAAARERFLADGVDGASLRTIARAARTNVGMIVYWFETKDDLFLAVVEESYGRLVADLDRLLGAPGTTRERLARAFARLGGASDEEVAIVRLVVREALLVPPSPRFARLLARFREGHLAMIARTLMEGVAAGEIDGSLPPPLLLVATFAMGGLPQIVRRVAGAEMPFAALPSPEALGERAVELLFGGIGAKPAPPPPPPAPTQKSKPRRPAKRPSRSGRRSSGA